MLSCLCAQLFSFLFSSYELLFHMVCLQSELCVRAYILYDDTPETYMLEVIMRIIY